MVRFTCHSKAPWRHAHKETLPISLAVKKQRAALFSSFESKQKNLILVDWRIRYLFTLAFLLSLNFVFTGLCFASSSLLLWYIYLYKVLQVLSSAC